MRATEGGQLGDRRFEHRGLAQQHQEPDRNGDGEQDAAGAAAGMNGAKRARDRCQSCDSSAGPFCARRRGCLRRPQLANERALRRRLRVLRGDREQRLERMQDRARIEPHRPRVGRTMRQHSGHGGSAETSAASSAQIMSTRVDNCSASLRLRQAEGRPQIAEEARNLRFQGGSRRRSSSPRPDARKRGSTCALRTRGRRRSRRHGAITHDQRHVRCSGLNFPMRIVRQKAALVKGAAWPVTARCLRLWRKT